MASKSLQSIKCFAGAGDSAVGKTCLLIAYTTGTFPGEYIPSLFDNYSANIWLDDRAINLGLSDYAPREDYDRLRPLYYVGCDVFVLQFSIERRSSFESILTKWHPEITHHCPKAPIVLVGNKCDLRDDIPSAGSTITNKPPAVTYEEGQNLAKQIGAVAYLECSAYLQRGVKEVFNTAMRAVLNQPNHGKKKKAGGCTFM